MWLKLWNWLDGKKRLFGWLIIQFPWLDQPTIFSAFGSEYDLIVNGIQTHSFAGLGGSTIALAGQVLLAVGIAHGWIKGLGSSPQL